jgi:hypothetical protein
MEQRGGNTHLSFGIEISFFLVSVLWQHRFDGDARDVSNKSLPTPVVPCWRFGPTLSKSL